MTDSPGTPSAAPSGRVLLIVDDEPDLAPLFRRFLKRHFGEILEASDAAQAVSMLASRPVTHLVVDASLPNGDSGQALIARWRPQFSTLRYVALFSGTSALRDVNFPGVDRVFIKPEGLDELLVELKK